MRSRETLAPPAPATSMADTLQLPKRGPSRSTWARSRKARPQLTLSRRPRRRLRLRLLRWCGRRRLRRRLLRAQAAGAEWREGGWRASRSAAAPGPQTAVPSRVPRPRPSPTPSRASSPTEDEDEDEDSAATCPERLPIPPLRPAGPGRALLLLPREQVFTFSGTCRVTCLYGQVQVFGFTISQGQPPQDVFSTYTHSRLALSAVHCSMPEKSKKEMKREARTLLRAHVNRDDRCWLMKNFSPLCSIVILENLKNATVNFITSHPGLSYVFEQERTTFQINAEYFALRSVGIKKEKKKNGLQLTESVLSALEELVSVACEEVDGCPIILVCGPPDVGKSTFNRYLINQLLNSISCVDYLECDLGQTEFTPPGCISLLNITEPLLGPPFTHQRTPQKMVYFGKSTCKNNYENYIEIIKYVFSSYKRESPLIINTMGWVTDQGLLLLVDLIRLLSPSHVVQISSSRSRFMSQLTPTYVDDMDGLYTKSKAKVRDRGFYLPEFADSLEFGDEEKESPVAFSGHKLMCVQLDFAFRKTPRNRESHNRVLRDLALLGYLGQLQAPAPKPLRPLHSLTPYQMIGLRPGTLSQLIQRGTVKVLAGLQAVQPDSRGQSVHPPLDALSSVEPLLCAGRCAKLFTRNGLVPFHAVALRVIHSDVAPTHVLYAVNASWVGLCKILDDVGGYTEGPVLLTQTPICDCLGFGICRGIDMEKRLYHILTPVPPEELRNVNCLLVGAISIPQCVLKSQHGFEGTIPYVTTDYNIKLPGATGKVGERETEETYTKRQHPKARFYRKAH